MKPDKCSFWFIHSFILDNFNFPKFSKILAENSNREDLGIVAVCKEVDACAFSPYVSFHFDELICKHVAEPSEGYPITITCSDINTKIRATIKRKYHIELTGLCAQITELEILDEIKLEITDLINLSNIYEKQLPCIQLNGSENLEAKFHPSALDNEDLDNFVKLLKITLDDEPIILNTGPISKDYADSSTEAGRCRQTPYVISVLGYNDSDEYRKKISMALESISLSLRKINKIKALTTTKDKDDSSENEARQLAALLYRFKTPEQWERVDLSYVNAFSSRRGNGIENFHLHEDIFVTIHLRSCLVAYNMEASKGNSHSHPPLKKIYFPALQATFADAHAKWYGFIQVNSHIDFYMQSFRVNTNTKPTDVLKIILILRNRIMGLLDSSVAHKRASGTLSELHKEFYRLFDVDGLKNDALTKIDLLEKVYLNLQQLSFLSNSDDIELQ